MFAVIETGGKQYKVASGQKIKVEKIETEDGSVLIFDKVLLISDKGEVAVGEPYLTGKKVEAKVIKQSRHKKVIVFKYKNKTRQARKKGHRQFYTEVEVTNII